MHNDDIVRIIPVTMSWEEIFWSFLIIGVITIGFALLPKKVSKE